MKKLEEIQSRKVMSAYGGVQSIIETAENGSLLVDFYDNWGCEKEMKNKNNEIEDPRLLNYIQKELGLDISKICKIPTPDFEHRKYYPNNKDLQQTIKSRYFPGWFYCPHCRRLHTLDKWKEKWEDKFNGNNSFGDYFPSCPYCSKQKGKRFSRQSLEQVRFLLASLDSGRVIDVPFTEIWRLDQKGKAWIMDGQQSTDAELTYRSSSGSDGLQSIYVKNEKTGERIYLSQIASKYIVYKNGENQGAYRLYLRNQNNIYYPQVINSLYIPYKDIEDVHKQGIISDYEIKRKSIPEIYNEIQNSRYAPMELKALSEADIQNIINGNLDYDAQEYAYIVNPHNYGQNTLQNRKEDFVAKKYPNIKVPFVQCMYAIMRLKMTSIVPSFTRIYPKGSETKWWDVSRGEEISQTRPEEVKTYSNNNGVDFIPGVESYGEGIFFEMDVANIDETERFTFVHTYSHMIMKELEFQCGYPLSSMKEKIYSSNNKWGILIYTIGSSEGSYGGLISLFPSEAKSDGIDSQIVKIINYAMERVKDCPNDPICEKEYGHCYACLDIPEISCCKWNNELNRNVFIKYKEKNEKTPPNIILD